jgi:hypothetical protein
LSTIEIRGLVMAEKQNSVDTSVSTVGVPAKGDEDPVLDSVALGRLIAEVRTEEVSMGRDYNRTYNRHNR